MNKQLKLALAGSLVVLAGHASAQITFYEGPAYHGRAFTTQKAVPDFARNGFNDRASSVVVDGGRWEVCEDARFHGRCVVLRRGSYESLAALGLENRISSVRSVGNGRHYDNEAPPPAPQANYEYRRRANERLFQAPVGEVHAVVGPPTQRCWVDRQQVSQPERSQPNMGNAIIGGLLGGVLGHQVGGGSGKDLATVGGVVAGAAIGSNMNRGDSGTSYAQDVRRCETTPSTTPAYWDVTYDFHGVQHKVQMASEPGRFIPVNRDGEPRM
jgi:uncharacterized protein YcfJ